MTTRRLLLNQSKDFIAIVRDGAISIPQIGDGRLIPCVILNCEKRPDIHDVVVLQGGQHPGDVVSTWAKNVLTADYIYLHLDFVRPTPAKASLIFDLRIQAALVDGIIQANALYIQPSTISMSVVQGIDKNKTLLEIPSDNLPFDWDKVFRKQLRKRFKRQGQNGNESTKSADLAFEKSRNMWQQRR